MSKLSLSSPIVSADWLRENLNASNLLIFDASMVKVTAQNENVSSEVQLPNTQFFNLKGRFSDLSSDFPNTIPSASQFQEEARKLGVNSDSAIVVYDDKGIYSSA